FALRSFLQPEVLACAERRCPQCTLAQDMWTSYYTAWSSVGCTRGWFRALSAGPVHDVTGMTIQALDLLPGALLAVCDSMHEAPVLTSATAPFRQRQGNNRIAVG